DDVIKRVLKGTKLRLRPVMMTASVAALGFFPMALSSAPGAEVQKPLATVVIGGLVTSTFLTLVILPVIYVMFNGGFKMRKSNKVTVAIFVLLMSIPVLQLNAQEKALTLDEAIAIATENNVEVRNASLDIEAAQKLKKSGFDLSPLEFEYDHGQLNSDLQDHYWSIRQPFSFPTVYTSQSRFYREVEKLNESRYLLVRQQLIRNVKSAYCTWSILYEKYGILKEKDSIYAGFNNATSVQFETGDIDQLAFVLAGSEATQVKSQLTEMETELAMAKQNLLQLMGVSFNIIPTSQLQKMEVPAINGEKPVDTSNVRTRYITQITEVQRSSLNREKMNHLPDFFVGYFNQSIDRVNGFEGFQVGASLPLWFWSNSGKVQASRIEVAKTENALDFEKQNLIREFQKQMAAYEGYRASLEYYENGGLEQIDQLIRNLQTSYRAGEINYFEFVRNIGLAFDVRLRYFDTLLKYNQSVIELEYLSAQ
ncbi:MAG: CusA/CzcA family heavy metal efflux RND transporter, partial [Bacteroidales bacterium]|nr:CusA/CzcA family heavy metal efflux RND transporter [Bacteroidales bacterium]